MYEIYCLRLQPPYKNIIKILKILTFVARVRETAENFTSIATNIKSHTSKTKYHSNKPYTYTYET